MQHAGAIISLLKQLSKPDSPKIITQFSRPKTCQCCHGKPPCSRPSRPTTLATVTDCQHQGSSPQVVLFKKQHLLCSQMALGHCSLFLWHVMATQDDHLASGHRLGYLGCACSCLTCKPSPSPVGPGHGQGRQGVCIRCLCSPCLQAEKMTALRMLPSLHHISI
jgi:hypothetical protein